MMKQVVYSLSYWSIYIRWKPNMISKVSGDFLAIETSLATPRWTPPAGHADAALAAFLAAFSGVAAPPGGVPKPVKRWKNGDFKHPRLQSGESCEWKILHVFFPGWNGGFLYGLSMGLEPTMGISGYFKLIQGISCHLYSCTASSTMYLTIGMMAGRPLLAKITLQLDGV